MNKKSRFLVLCVLSCSFFVSFAQRGEEKMDKAKMESYRYQCESLVKYYEETLNFLGDPETLPKERQIVINDSYQKIFRDNEVQIEDDLISDRITVFYKPVQAYLRDVNFFYKQVTFAYRVQTVEPFYNAKGSLCFKVTANRFLQGSNIKGETYEDNMVRYFEIEYNADREDLKIVSIYTTLLEESEDLANWWLSMSPFWRSFFAKETVLDGGIKMSDIVTFTETTISFSMNQDFLDKIQAGQIFYKNAEGADSIAYQLYVPPKKTTTPKGKTPPPPEPVVSDTLINIVYPGKLLQPLISKLIKQTEFVFENIKDVDDLSPLTKMTGLTRISLSNNDVTDLTPIRNLNKLEALKISQTKITDLSPISFLINLKEIDLSESAVTDISSLSDNLGLNIVNISNTRIQDITPLASLPSLVELRIDGTPVPDLKPLSKATSLQILTLNNTQIQDLTPIKDLSALTVIKFDQSKVTSLAPLSNCKKLAEASFNQTPVSDITPISQLPELKTVYCKKTSVPQTNILEFIQQNPNTLTIFNTDEMETWWSLLTPYWQEYFSGRIGFYGTPTETDLAAITAINRIDISSRKTVTDINCFNKIWMLRQLDASMSGITSLVSLADLPYLQKVIINYTEINDVSPLQKLPRLDTLLANNTKIKTVSVLKDAPALRLIECDNTGVVTDDVVVLRTANPDCTVIFNTGQNNQWWADVSPTWKKVLYGSENTPDKYQLQQILNTTTIDVGENRDIRELSPLLQFNYLTKLVIRGTFVGNLKDVAHIKTLTFLDISNTPIVSIDEIASLSNMDTLRMENTQLKKYETVGQLKNLKLLDVSGTQIKDLKPLSSLTHLEDLSCNNTGVSALKPLENLPNLKKLRIFRTKISERTVKDFKAKQPECEVVYY
ncbi:MAG: hypothetical protein FWG84_03590 [Bacteroidales bacterium]|nr:hypothetical protein [Bacteroidales bacterium]